MFLFVCLRVCVYVGVCMVTVRDARATNVSRAQLLLSLAPERPQCTLHCTALSLPTQRIAYAKSKSDAIAKLDGTYVEKKKKKVEERKSLFVCVRVNGDR